MAQNRQKVIFAIKFHFMQTGSILSPFQLPNTDNEILSSVQLKGINGLLVIFACNHCPHVHKYASRISDLAMEYRSKGLGIVAINSNDASRYPDDSFDNMQKMGEWLGLDKHYLYDESQEIARKFKAERTPETYLFNSSLHLIYRGAIDDNVNDINHVNNQYLRDALEANLNNNIVQNPYIPPIGCSIKWKLNA